MENKKTPLQEQQHALNTPKPRVTRHMLTQVTDPQPSPESYNHPLLPQLPKVQIRITRPSMKYVATPFHSFSDTA